MVVRGVEEGPHPVPQIRSEDKSQMSFSRDRVNEKEVTVGLKEPFDFKKIYSIKSEIYSSVRLLKEEDIMDLIENISEDLFNINKIFPPYPPGGEERISTLKSFIAFRTLIERLTIPPEQTEEITRLSAELAEQKSLDIKHTLSSEKTSLTKETAFLKEF